MDKKIIPNEILLEDAARLLCEGRDVSFTPRGSSMLPFIRDGKDTVTLRAITHVDVGDIVLARLSGSTYVLHRVVDRNRSLLTLMGDGNLQGSESCTREDVLGTVVAINGHKPCKGRIWRMLMPLRRILLAIFRRIL